MACLLHSSLSLTSDILWLDFSNLGRDEVGWYLVHTFPNSYSLSAAIGNWNWRGQERQIIENKQYLEDSPVSKLTTKQCFFFTNR